MGRSLISKLVAVLPSMTTLVEYEKKSVPQGDAPVVVILREE